jgi:putative ABC transport system ATP-binding protein
MIELRSDQTLRKTSHMSENAVQANNILFSYPKSPEQFFIRNLAIPVSEKLFLYGPSGSGKSTLLGIIAGILNFSKGELNVLGESYSNLTNSQKDLFRGQKIGYIFQQFNLIPYLTVKENLLLSLSFVKQKKFSHTAYLDNAFCLSKNLGIENILNHLASEISVGQQQRVAAARAFLHSPQLIIADEPTSSLDAQSREQFIFTLFEEAQKSQATLIFVSHDMSLAKLFSAQMSLQEVLTKK